MAVIGAPKQSSISETKTVNDRVTQVYYTIIYLFIFHEYYTHFFFKILYILYQIISCFCEKYFYHILSHFIILIWYLMLFFSIMFWNFISFFNLFSHTINSSIYVLAFGS
jgi:hypothetical protein